MDPNSSKFGSGPRELTGAVDLISHFKLLPHHDYFCKKSLPVSIADTHYLHNVVGDTEIRKGDGMQLDQLIQNNSRPRDGNIRIQPFDLDVLREAFQLKESSPVDLPAVSISRHFLEQFAVLNIVLECLDLESFGNSALSLLNFPLYLLQSEKGTPTIAGKSKSESKDKERKHKKHKDKDKDKDREHKKHKHRHKDRDKDRSKDKDKEKKRDKSGHHESGADHTRKHHEKKRRHDGDEDLNDVHRHKKSKHKSSKIDEMGAIRVAG
ncbi:Mediator of RNA polymerase II transcription subunit 19a [Linum perenne]